MKKVECVNYFPHYSYPFSITTNLKFEFSTENTHIICQSATSVYSQQAN